MPRAKDDLAPPPGEETRFDAEALERYVGEIFRRAGMTEAQAAALVWCNLHGIDSHGVLRVPCVSDMNGR